MYRILDDFNSPVTASSDVHIYIHIQYIYIYIYRYTYMSLLLSEGLYSPGWSRCCTKLQCFYSPSIESFQDFSPLTCRRKTGCTDLCPMWFYLNDDLTFTWLCRCQFIIYLVFCGFFMGWYSSCFSSTVCHYVVFPYSISYWFYWLCMWQVNGTFIYIALSTIQIVSKQLHSNKLENNSGNVAKCIIYDTNSVSAVKRTEDIGSLFSLI